MGILLEGLDGYFCTLWIKIVCWWNEAKLNAPKKSWLYVKNLWKIPEIVLGLHWSCFRFYRLIERYDNNVHFFFRAEKNTWCELISVCRALSPKKRKVNHRFMCASRFPISPCPVFRYGLHFGCEKEVYCSNIVHLFGYFMRRLTCLLIRTPDTADI